MLSPHLRAIFRVACVYFFTQNVLAYHAENEIYSEASYENGESESSEPNDDVLASITSWVQSYQPGAVWKSIDGLYASQDYEDVYAIINNLMAMQDDCDGDPEMCRTIDAVLLRFIKTYYVEGGEMMGCDGSGNGISGSVLNYLLSKMATCNDMSVDEMMTTYKIDDCGGASNNEEVEEEEREVAGGQNYYRRRLSYTSPKVRLHRASRARYSKQHTARKHAKQSQFAKGIKLRNEKRKKQVAFKKYLQRSAKARSHVRAHKEHRRSKHRGFRVRQQREERVIPQFYSQQQFEQAPYAFNVEESVEQPRMPFLQSEMVEGGYSLGLAPSVQHSIDMGGAARFEREFHHDRGQQAFYVQRPEQRLEVEVPSIARHEIVQHENVVVPSVAHHEVQHERLVVPSVAHHEMQHERVVVPSVAHHEMQHERLVVPSVAHHEVQHERVEVPAIGHHEIVQHERVVEPSVAHEVVQHERVEGPAVGHHEVVQQRVKVPAIEITAQPERNLVVQEERVPFEGKEEFAVEVQEQPTTAEYVPTARIIKKMAEVEPQVVVQEVEIPQTTEFRTVAPTVTEPSTVVPEMVYSTMTNAPMVVVPTAQAYVEVAKASGGGVMSGGVMSSGVMSSGVMSGAHLQGMANWMQNGMFNARKTKRKKVRTTKKITETVENHEHSEESDESTLMHFMLMAMMHIPRTDSHYHFYETLSRYFHSNHGFLEGMSIPEGASNEQMFRMVLQELEKRPEVDDEVKQSAEYYMQLPVNSDRKLLLQATTKPQAGFSYLMNSVSKPVDQYGLGYYNTLKSFLVSEGAAQVFQSHSGEAESDSLKRMIYTILKTPDAAVNVKESAAYFAKQLIFNYASLLNIFPQPRDDYEMRFYAALKSYMEGTDIYLISSDIYQDASLDNTQKLRLILKAALSSSLISEEQRAAFKYYLSRRPFFDYSTLITFLPKPTSDNDQKLYAVMLDYLRSDEVYKHTRDFYVTDFNGNMDALVQSFLVTTGNTADVPEHIRVAAKYFQMIFKPLNIDVQKVLTKKLDLKSTLTDSFDFTSFTSLEYDEYNKLFNYISNTPSINMNAFDAWNERTTRGAFTRAFFEYLLKEVELPADIVYVIEQLMPLIKMTGSGARII